MKVPKNYDPVSKDAIAPDKGTDFCDNPGIDPGITPIAMTPGEKSTNDTAGRDISKAQPFGKGGSGYSNKD